MSETKHNDQADAETTHFGFQKVRVEDKARRVADVFHSVANKYDLMNDLMSLGIHRIWKRFAVELCGVRSGHQVLDVAAGTGDLSRYFSRLVGARGQVVLADINASMLETGRGRLIDAGFSDNLSYVQADAEHLPFAANSFDCISIAFGLRNVTDKAAALKSMTEALKPGGRLLVLEFSKPVNPLLGKAYDAYSFNVLPKLGQLITGDSDSYRYLAESIRMHPGQAELKLMLEQAGLEQCDYHNLSGGIVAAHRGIKP